MRGVGPLLLAVALAGGSCVAPATGDPIPRLAHAEVSGDFASYELYRVGLLPFTGGRVEPQGSRDLQLALFSEFTDAAPYEILLLAESDLEELAESEPYRRGWYEPETIIGISKRYNLDALLFGTVIQRRTYPPQVLSLQVDLVSAETGLVLWSCSVHLDAADREVRDGLRLFYGGRHPDPGGSDWSVALLSPERFARFAAYQLASLL